VVFVLAAAAVAAAVAAHATNERAKYRENSQTSATAAGKMLTAGGVGAFRSISYLVGFIGRSYTLTIRTGTAHVHDGEINALPVRQLY